MLNLLLAIKTDKEALKKSLEVLWKGLLAILVVIVIIMIVTYIMQAISIKSQNKIKQKEMLEKENAEKTQENK